MVVFWTDAALEDLREVGCYVALDDPRASVRVVDGLLQAALLVGDQPHAGRMVPEFGWNELRERIVGNYRLVYRIGAKRIEILTVLEGHRLLRTKFDTEGP